MKRTVAHYIDSKEVGGAEKMVFTILKSIDRDKWKPVLIYHPSSGITQFTEKIQDLGIELITIPGIKSWRDLSGFISFIKALRSVKPKIFHAHLPWNLSCSYGIVSAFLSRVPVIVATQHAFEIPKGRKITIYQKLISLVIDRYIAVSNGLAELLKKVLVHKHRILVIYNGIDIERYANITSSNLRTELNLGKNVPIIMTIARMDKLKGHRFLLHAIPNVPDAIFVFAGNGPEAENLKKLAKELGIEDRVIFLGHREDIPQLLNGCDILIQPSLVEALGIAVIEAMAAGKPVIGSDISGLDEVIINNETGILVPKENPEALSNAINHLLSNPEYAAKLGTAGKARAEKEFSDEYMIKEISALYEQLIYKN